MAATVVSTCVNTRRNSVVSKDSKAKKAFRATHLVGGLVLALRWSDTSPASLDCLLRHVVRVGYNIASDIISPPSRAHTRPATYPHVLAMVRLAPACSCALGTLLGLFATTTFSSGLTRAGRATEFDMHLLPEVERMAAVTKAAPDVAKHLPISFDPAFATPCWRDVNSSKTRCLPAFFLAGAMQCGADSLWRRLKAHAHVPSAHDALSHWWTLHPRSRAGTFDRYVDLLMAPSTLSVLSRSPQAQLGEASPATFTFMMAEQLRLHYLYLDAFSACHAKCRSRSPPAHVATQCSDSHYDLGHCYPEANAATVPEAFNLPSLVATVMQARKPKLIVLLREPALRLWVAFHEYGQYPARYGGGAAGFTYYFGNQSAAWARCVVTDGRGRRRCALRFEAYGAAEAGVYYHSDQVRSPNSRTPAPCLRHLSPVHVTRKRPRIPFPSS